MGISLAITNPRDIAFKEEVEAAVEVGMKKIRNLPKGAQEVLIRNVSDSVRNIAGAGLTEEVALLGRYEALLQQGWIIRTANDPQKKPYTPSDF